MKTYTNTADLTDGGFYSKVIVPANAGTFTIVKTYTNKWGEWVDVEDTNGNRWNVRADVFADTFKEV